MTAIPSSTCRAEAHACIDRGSWVFPLHSVRPDGHCTCGAVPCADIGKHPRTSHGLDDATLDHDQVNTWFDRWSLLNLAIATGPESGLVVVDVDPRHGGDVTLAELEREHGAVPLTPESLTGGGGRHILFQHPGWYVASRANALGPGLDARGDRGYIVAAGSLHASGRTYAWDASRHPDDVPLAPLPAWMAEALAAAPGSGVGRTPEEWQDLIANVAPTTQRAETLLSVVGKVFACRTLPLAMCVELVWSWAMLHLEKPFDERKVRKILAWAVEHEAQRRLEVL